MDDLETRAATMAPQLASEIGGIINVPLMLVSREREGDLFASDDGLDFYFGVVAGFSDVVTQSLGLEPGGSFQQTLILHLFLLVLDQSAAEQASDTVFAYMLTAERPEVFDYGLKQGSEAGNSFAVDQDPSRSRRILLLGFQEYL